MNNFIKRKNLRLKNYDYSQNGYYFVTLCTHNRQHLFGEIVGATLRGRPNNPDKMVERWLFEIVKKFDAVKLHEFVIMPDHIHFIISQTGDHTGSPLRDIIGWFKTMTTNEYIKSVKENKFLPFFEKFWQRNYYEHVIRNDIDYDEKAQYILNNPIKWELEKITGRGDPAWSPE